MGTNWNEWDKIGDKLCNYLGICSCQRKLKSIVDVLICIKEKGKRGDHDWTPAEYLILALLDSKNLITHGTNCEYPIIVHLTKDDEGFWDWLEEIKDNPNLVDN